MVARNRIYWNQDVVSDVLSLHRLLKFNLAVGGIQEQYRNMRGLRWLLCTQEVAQHRYAEIDSDAGRLEDCIALKYTFLALLRNQLHRSVNDDFSRQ